MRTGTPQRGCGRPLGGEGPRKGLLEFQKPFSQDLVSCVPSFNSFQGPKPSHRTVQGPDETGDSERSRWTQGEWREGKRNRKGERREKATERHTHRDKDREDEG